MTPKQKIISWMYHKSHALEKLQRSPLYFWQKDERAILKWSDLECERVWRKIFSEVIEYGENAILNGGGCPFCIYHYDVCSDCTYGKLHGNCHETPSHYMKLFMARRNLMLSKDVNVLIALVKQWGLNGDEDE
jgi:hypothetical protein